MTDFWGKELFGHDIKAVLDAFATMSLKQRPLVGINVNGTLLRDRRVHRVEDVFHGQQYIVTIEGPGGFNRQKIIWYAPGSMLQLEDTDVKEDILESILMPPQKNKSSTTMSTGKIYRDAYKAPTDKE